MTIKFNNKNVVNTINQIHNEDLPTEATYTRIRRELGLDNTTQAFLNRHRKNLRKVADISGASDLLKEALRNVEQQLEREVRGLRHEL